MNALRTVALVVLLVAVSMNARVGASSASPSVTGAWIGSLNLGSGVTLRIIIRVFGAQGALSASLESPDQGPGEVPMDTASETGADFRFSSTKIDASYEGTVSLSGKSITGIFTQHGMQYPLKLARYTEAIAAGQVVSIVEAARVVGTWNGKIIISNNMSLRVVFTFARTNGVLTGTMTSPDQSPLAAPTQPRLQNKTLDITVPANGGSFHGTLKPDGSVHGAWTQNGQHLPLDLTRSGQSQVPIDRPQTPIPPYPYDVREVTFPGGAPGVTLAGTLTEPSGAGPFPAVVLVAGSGPNDRDETIFGHKPFLVIADYLTRRGIAVLRYDKRGVGSSKGDYEDATSIDFTHDALGAVGYLKSRSDIQAEHIGLIGHSEGGMIAPIVATRSKDVAFIVLLAGDGVRGDKLLSRQIEQVFITEGKGSPTIKATQDFIQDQYRLETGAKAYQSPKAAAAAAEHQPYVPLSIVELVASRWGEYFLTYDPGPTLGRVKCPVLALDGSLDLQVDPEQNLPAIQAALQAGGNKDFTIKELPGLNHLFQPAKTGSPADYAAIETTIDPSVLSLVGDWIDAHVKG